MAVKWAVANGNWADGTTWNDGVVPTTNDRVYLNGYIVALNVNTIEVKELRSDSNIENNISDGGCFTMTSGYVTIVCEKVVQGVGTNYFINKTNWANGRWLQINGDVYTSEQASLSVIHISSGINNVLVNGNIYLRGGYFLSQMQKNLTVNGNIISLVQMQHPFCANYSSGGCSYTVNGIIDFGNIKFEQTENITLTINGVVKNAVLYATAASYFSGEYQYEGQPVIKLPMNFSQDYRFVAINEEVPILVNPNTIADTYPPEDKVLTPTQYGAQMELIGTYTPDYPPESVVLKDYVYDNGERTGTLENEVTVESRNTINVYPYAKRVI